MLPVEKKKDEKTGAKNKYNRGLVALSNGHKQTSRGGDRRTHKKPCALVPSRGLTPPRRAYLRVPECDRRASISNRPLGKGLDNLLAGHEVILYVYIYYTKILHQHNYKCSTNLAQVNRKSRPSDGLSTTTPYNPINLKIPPSFLITVSPYPSSIKPFVNLQPFSPSFRG